MITSYEILESRTTSDLAIMITAAIKDGKQPYGPPFFNQVEGSYCQAVTSDKTLPEKPPEKPTFPPKPR